MVKEKSKNLIFYVFLSAIKCVTWETFTENNEFKGHTKNILCGDFRKVKPLKIITGGEDFLIVYHDGLPFKLTGTIKEHSNFVSCLKYNFDYSQYASAGFDKKIQIFDALTNTVLYVLCDANSEGVHNGAIIQLIWIDNDTIATTSIDKTVKIWDLKEKELKFTLFPVEKESLGENEIGCGLVYSKTMNYLISITLNGKINIWNYENLVNEQKPDIVVDGHQTTITHVRYSKKLEKLISADTNGIIGISLIFYF